MQWSRKNSSPPDGPRRNSRTHGTASPTRPTSPKKSPTQAPSPRQSLPQLEKGAETPAGARGAEAPPTSTVTDSVPTAKMTDADRRLKKWRETDYVLGIYWPHPRSKNTKP